MPVVAPVSYVFFVLTVLLYLAGATAYFIYFYFRQWERASTLLARAAFVAHSITLAALVVELRHPPLYTTHEALLFLAWVITFNYLMMETLFRLKVAGTFVIPLVFGLLAYTATLLPVGEPSSVPTASLWVVVHAVIALGGYGAFALAFVAGLMYLVQDRQLRTKAFHTAYRRLPPLETLDGMVFRLVIYGLPLLVLAIASGSFWARSTWGVRWFLEPKGIWSLITLLIYVVYVTARVKLGWVGRKTVYIAVIGFAAVLLNLFYVNMVSRMHGF